MGLTVALRSLATRPAREVLDLRLERPVPAVLAAVTLVSLWLLGRRYPGIVHDATLYVALALNRLEPQAFARDLFFANGSQDSYSVFSALYAPLVGLLGAPAAALVVVLAGQAGFVLAAWALAARLFPATRWWSVALLAVLSGYYGGGGAVRVAEPFATARTLAEPLVLAALVCVLARREVLALIALGAATLLHPLVAMPGWGFLVLWHAWGKPRALAGVVAGVAALGALLASLPPVFDAAWHEAVVERSRHLFVLEWQLADHAKLAWAAGIAGLAVVHASALARRTLGALLAVALTGLATNLLFVDLLRSAPATALQPWRVLWLLQVAATLAAPAVAVLLWRRDRAGQLAAACVAASCCFGRNEGVIAAALVLAAALLAHGGVALRIDHRRLRLGFVAVACLASVGLFFDIRVRLPDAYAPRDDAAWRAYLRALSSAGALLPLAALLWLGMKSRFARAAAALAACAFALSVAVWDARSTWSHYVERGGAAHPFRALVRPGEEVFWPGASSPAWTVLARANWFSVDQGAGVVFARATALEWPAREAASRALRESVAFCALTQDPECRIDPALARRLCRMPRGPHYLVVNGRLDGETPLARDAYHGLVLRLYSCAALRGARAG